MSFTVLQSVREPVPGMSSCARAQVLVHFVKQYNLGYNSPVEDKPQHSNWQMAIIFRECKCRWVRDSIRHNIILVLKPSVRAIRAGLQLFAGASQLTTVNKIIL